MVMVSGGCIGFIGAGNMASAIIGGIIDAGRDPATIMVSDPNESALAALTERTGVRPAADNNDLISRCQHVVLAVKPQVIGAVLEPLQAALAEHRPLVISIAAGITLEGLEGLCPPQLPLVRVMPNVNALVGAGVAAVCGNAAAGDEGVAVALELFEAVGLALPLPETLFSVFTAIAGSGPAYVFNFVDQLARAGVRDGLPRDLATRIAAHTVLGSARLLTQRDGTHPQQLVDMVSSPGGTTAAGLLAGEAAGFNHATHAMVSGALKRADELGA